MNVLVLLWALPAAVAPQTPPSVTTVSGVVTDSLRHAPLAGAIVQFAPTRTRDETTAPARAWTARTDSLGRYTISDLAPGRYLVGFFHPRLDSLGFTTEPRAVDVGTVEARVDFGVPAATTIIAAVCPGRAVNDSSGLLLGHVRSATSLQPRDGAVVVAEWTELVQEAVLVRPQARVIARPATAEGWFAICGIAPDVPVLVRGAAGTDTSGYVRLTIPAREVVRQALYVGEAAAPLVRVSGTVRDQYGRAVASAEAHVWGTERRRRVSSTGRFRLDSVPAGTQTIEVRAVGYVPVTRVVHLTAAALAEELALVLDEPVTMLPTTTVTARRSTHLRLDAFFRRMADAEKGINRGYFFTPEELERRKPPLVTNMFDGLPGIYVDRPLNRLHAVVRGPLQFGGGGNATRCEMAVFLDGIQVIGGMKGHQDTIDKLVVPSQIAAIEVYPHPVSAPPQYQMLNGTCGIILIWYK